MSNILLKYQAIIFGLYKKQILYFILKCVPTIYKQIWLKVVTLFLISFSEGRNDHNVGKECRQRVWDRLQRRLLLDAADSRRLSFVVLNFFKDIWTSLGFL